MSAGSRFFSSVRGGGSVRLSMIAEMMSDPKNRIKKAAIAGAPLRREHSIDAALAHAEPAGNLGARNAFRGQPVDLR